MPDSGGLGPAVAASADAALPVGGGWATAVAALVAALAVGLWAGGGGAVVRRRHESGPSARPDRVRAEGAALAVTRVGQLLAVLRRRLRPGRSSAVELGVVCTNVASRLRAGVSPARAWETELERWRGTAPPGSRGAEGPVPGEAGTGDASTGEAGVPAALAALAGTSQAADAAILASRVAHSCGAPLAQVLESVAVVITEAEAAQADRRRARAGPAATARILGWLPLASLLVGASLGADPIGQALAGGWAALSMILGVLAWALGRSWTRRLVRRAEQPPPASGPRGSRSLRGRRR